MSKLRLAKDAAEKALAIELDRAGGLMRNAWLFLAGIIVVAGFQLRDLKSLVESPSPTVKILCCASLAVLSAALVLSGLAMQANGGGLYPRGQKLWESLKPETVSDAAAEEALVQMLLQAREPIARANDAKARILRWCGWLFVAGSLLVVGSQVLDAFVSWT
jgi:hypothetical protein